MSSNIEIQNNTGFNQPELNSCPKLSEQDSRIRAFVTVMFEGLKYVLATLFAGIMLPLHLFNSRNYSVTKGDFLATSITPEEDVVEEPILNASPVEEAEAIVNTSVQTRSTVPPILKWELGVYWSLLTVTYLVICLKNS